jgi:hypothetical protein
MANPGMRVGPSDGKLDGQRLPVGVSFSEDMPTDFSHSKSRNSPEPVPPTLTLAVCESTQINQSSEGGRQALTSPTSSETVNAAPHAAPDISMASNLDIGHSPAEMVFEKSPDSVELIASSSGIGTSPSGLKRKMNGSDREGDVDHVAHVASNGEPEFKRKRITTVEEDDPDIIYIGSWTPPAGKSRKRNIARTAVKMENLPVKLENPVSDSNVSAKHLLMPYFLDPCLLGRAFKFTYYSCEV